MSIDPYYTYDTRTRAVLRLRKGPHWGAHHFVKNYVESATGRHRNVADQFVYRNERDAAIALTTALTAAAKKSIEHAQGLQDHIAALIAKHDIGDCPYLAPDGAM